tara:strand:- start:3039 stop:3743 length:705 start_codon:yes stop_codon:yes gene_type:complete
MKIYAIIPARSNSKRFKNKNIKKLNKIPLFMHSINFAKKLKFIDKIIFTTDSNKYLNKIEHFQKLIKHKRSKKASTDQAMEEDIIKDLKIFFLKKSITIPHALLWLRPTHPLRSKKTFEKGFKLFSKYKKSVLIVHKEDSRLFKQSGKYITPLNKKFKKRSMIRSQDCKPYFSIFSGEYFIFPRKISKKFLSMQKLFVVSDKYTNVDIDNNNDFKILQNLISSNPKFYKKYLHD